MDRENRRRYFVIGSVVVEIVQPILRTKLENEYTVQGFSTLQDFLGSKLHTLFHLRHKGICCTDSANCSRKRGSLPLNYYQWDLMYAENPGPANHHCHCRFTARSVLLSDLDISLSSLILLNCFPLSNIVRRTIQNLRTLKNNYLSHNTKGAIKEPEYRLIWADLSMYINHLDSTKQDDLIRIERRPLDPDLCHRYHAELLGMHQMLDDIVSSINDIGCTINELRDDVRKLLKIVFTTQKPSIKQRSIGTEVDASYFSSIDQTRHYSLGRNIFSLHRKIELSDVVVDDMVMMDDGRVVMCFTDLYMLIICDTERLRKRRITCHKRPRCITAVNSHTVAVTCTECFVFFFYITLYDINNKAMLKSFKITGMLGVADITTVYNSLVVTGIKKLLIVDYHTEKVVQKLHIDYIPDSVHGYGGKIYCNSGYNDKNLYCYSITGQLLFAITLPSHPYCMTSINDGSLYVGCVDGSVRHISSHDKKYKQVENIRLKKGDKHLLSYNHKQDKLCITSGCILIGSFIRLYHKK